MRASACSFPLTSETTVTDDLIIVANSSGLGSKYESQSVPVLDLIPWHWAGYGMITGSVSYGGQRNITITDTNHDLAGNLSGSVQYAGSYHGYGYVTGTQLNGDADVVGDIGGTGQHSYFAYETGDTLADSSTAAERHIGLGGFYDTSISPTPDGWTLFDAAIDWAADGAGSTGGAGTGTSTGGGWVESGVIYTYDNRGNRVGVGSDVYKYDYRNRLTEDPEGLYTWHDDGTLDTFVPNSGGLEQYTFDAATRLTGITDGTDTTSYVYDGLDRIAARNNSDFSYAGGELDPVSDGIDLFHRTPDGSLLAYETSAGTAYPFSLGHHDLNGLFSADGVLTDSATFDPYGDPVDNTGSTDPVLGFQSDYTDPTTEHVWMGARWYQPSSATFLSRDTVYGELRTPFTLNRYTYAVNNPIRYWDPTGRSIECEDVWCWEADQERKAEEAGFYDEHPNIEPYYADPTPRSTAVVQSTTLLNVEAQVANILAQRAADQLARRSQELETLKSRGLLPAVLTNIDLTFIFASEENYRIVLNDLVRLTRNLAGSRDDHIQQEFAHRSAEMGNFVRCQEPGLGSCYTAPSGWELVLEIAVDVLAGALCVGTVALATSTAGAATPLAVTACVVVDGMASGLAGNWFAGRPLTDGLLLDAVVSGGSAGLLDGAIRFNRFLKTGSSVVPSGSLDNLVPSCLRSFSGDTEVLMADGSSKPISDVVVGDEVLASDPVAGDTGAKVVTAVWPHEDLLLKLEVVGGSVVTTEDHRFWSVSDGEWQESRLIEAGDLLAAAGGGTVEVVGLDWGSLSSGAAFDLTVEGYHSFYVDAGVGDVLVHNTNDLCGISNSTPGNTLYHYTDDAGLDGIVSSGELRPSLGSVNPNDVRYGNGQYVSDIVPGSRTCAQLSRCFLGQPFQGQRFTHFAEISVNVVKGRDGVFVIPGDNPLGLAGRIVKSGPN